jgi:hypothetical protein
MAPWPTVKQASSLRASARIVRAETFMPRASNRSAHSSGVSPWSKMVAPVGSGIRHLQQDIGVAVFIQPTPTGEVLAAQFVDIRADVMTVRDDHLLQGCYADRV